MVIAAVRDVEDVAFAGSVSELLDIGQQLFGAGYVELAARQHEV